jgi:hypothetical protein
MIRGKYHIEQKEKGKAAHDKGGEVWHNRRKRERLRMIKGRVQTEQKEKGKATHDKRESLDSTGVPQQKE